MRLLAKIILRNPLPCGWALKFDERILLSIYFQELADHFLVNANKPSEESAKK